MKDYLVKLNEYLNKYENKYPKEAIEYINNNFTAVFNGEIVPDLLLQIYSALNIIPENRNIYKLFLEKIETNYGLDKNILEIGCGYYPALARLIDFSQQKQKRGTITAYDKNLVTTSVGNIILHDRNFNQDESVSNYDLIVGLLPCKGTELIINKANSENKEFILSMCGCTHFPYTGSPFFI